MSVCFLLSRSKEFYVCVCVCTHMHVCMQAAVQGR